MLVLDPALIGYVGHHAEFARALKKELAAFANVRLYANFWAETRLLVNLRAEPVFFESIYRVPGDFASTYRRAIDLLLLSLDRIRPDCIEPRTVLISHTVTIYELLALANWYSKISAPNRPTLLIQFQFPLEFGVDRQSSNDAVRMGRAAAMLLEETGSVHFASNSRRLANNISAQIGQPVEILPIPVRWPKVSTIIPTTYSKPVFGFFGGLRREKGADLIAEVLPQFLARHSDIRCIVHAPAPESHPAAVQGLLGIPRLELITRSFRTKREYFAAFRRCSCILLPYDPDLYEVRTSGVFIEAIGLGQAVITTDGTWMESQLSEKDRGFLLPEFSADGLLTALERALGDFGAQGFTATPRQEVIDYNSPQKWCAEMLRMVKQQ